MERGGLELQIDIALDEDADAGELDDAALQLREELLVLDVGAVERPTDGEIPTGSRSVGAVILGTLIVTATKDVVDAITDAVAGWLSRRQHGSVTLTIGDDAITIDNPSLEDQRELLGMFIQRHSGGAT